MKKSRLWMFAAILIFSTMAVMAASTKDNMANDVGNEMEQYKETIRSWYGENKTIVDGNYDKSLAVKCINGTFVGKKVDNTIVFKGIPYVGQQPIGSLRWKAPVDATPNDGVYEAYYNAKAAPQPEVELSSIYYQSLYGFMVEPTPKEWPLYDMKDRQVMVLDEFDIHTAKESELKIVDWERTYFLTNYYMP